MAPLPIDVVDKRGVNYKGRRQSRSFAGRKCSVQGPGVAGRQLGRKKKEDGPHIVHTIVIVGICADRAQRAAGCQVG